MSIPERNNSFNGLNASSVVLPEIWPSNINFKVVLKATAKLPSKKWVELWNAEVFGTYKGSLSN